MADPTVTAVALMVCLAILLETSKKATEHAVEVARKLNVSETAIGFVLVSVATSLPELTISVTSALNRKLDLSVGNVFGANISNLLLVTGIAAFVGVGMLSIRETRRLALILLGVTMISFPLLLFEPGRIMGLILVVVFFAYSFYLMNQGKETVRARNFRKAIPEILFFLTFIAAVILSAKITVDFALRLSNSIGIAETILGATLISIGTTLPELSVSLAAARSNHMTLALGNAIGSCLVNISLVLGTGLLIYPFVTTASAARLILFSIIANVLVLFLAGVVKKLDRVGGAILVTAYVAFLAYFLMW